MYRSRGLRRSGPMLTMSPSIIHHINSDTVDIISPELDKSIIEVSKNALKAGELLKIQAVQKDGQWFALNSAQLDLCRRLEDEGSCQVVLVDPVPVTEIPEDVRRMMRVPVDRGRVNRKTVVARTGNEEQQETDNSCSHTAELVEGQVGTTVVGCGGKGYRMLDQTDPLDRQTMKVLSHQAGPADRDDDVMLQNNGECHQGQTVRDATDESSDDDDSSDSECDWSDEGDESGSEDDRARLADTSDEMSCLL